MPNYVEQWKQYKAPLWARLLGWSHIPAATAYLVGHYRRWKRNRQWKYIATIRLYEKFMGDNGRIRAHILHLFERADGKKRRVVFHRDGIGNHYSSWQDFRLYVRPCLEMETNDLGDVRFMEMVSKQWPTAKGNAHGGTWGKR